jgi:hypothetical protein
MEAWIRLSLVAIVLIARPLAAAVAVVIGPTIRASARRAQPATEYRVPAMLRHAAPERAAGRPGGHLGRGRPGAPGRAVARIFGDTVAAIGITDEKLQLARDLGADLVIDARTENPAAGAWVRLADIAHQTAPRLPEDERE